MYETRWILNIYIYICLRLPPVFPRCVFFPFACLISLNLHPVPLPVSDPILLTVRVTVDACEKSPHGVHLPRKTRHWIKTFHDPPPPPQPIEKPTRHIPIQRLPLKKKPRRPHRWITPTSPCPLPDVFADWKSLCVARSHCMALLCGTLVDCAQPVLASGFIKKLGPICPSSRSTVNRE